LTPCAKAWSDALFDGENTGQKVGPGQRRLRRKILAQRDVLERLDRRIRAILGDIVFFGSGLLQRFCFLIRVLGRG